MNSLMNNASISRNVLIVDDEMINREILGNILSQRYKVYYAENGKAATEFLMSGEHDISLILLDLLMPVMDGFEFLELRNHTKDIKRIPVIVMTSEKAAEVKSIRLGAADFITKPYELPEVILARCERIIELSEDKSIIQSTERDSVTGLYHKDYFFEYIRKLNHQLNIEMDAVAINIDHFHLLNELYGRKEGDRILFNIAVLISEVLQNTPGIACRVEADTFYIYCESQQDHVKILSDIQKKLLEMSCASRIRLRAGIFKNVDKDAMPETMFDHAKTACDRLRGDFMHQLGYYSDALHKQSLYQERLISDIQSAIDNHDLVVYYQPKYYIQDDQPRLKSAEALVRWYHPELGMISPGDFIPLFESNGLIQYVDNFVWREAAKQVKRWKEQYGVTIPVSVNVSRIDVFDPELENKLTDILESTGLTPDDIMLEITETAYSDNGKHLIKVIEHLQNIGFKIEMDDFGSGYSSLNMLNSISIDVLKMDMKFIRNMLKDERSFRLVEIILEISKILGVPAIAEGVEDEAQLKALKELGCEYIQGYYFSKPVPPEEFAPFIEKELKLSNGGKD